MGENVDHKVWEGKEEKRGWHIHLAMGKTPIWRLDSEVNSALASQAKGRGVALKPL